MNHPTKPEPNMQRDLCIVDGDTARDIAQKLVDQWCSATNVTAVRATHIDSTGALLSLREFIAAELVGMKPLGMRDLLPTGDLAYMMDLASTLQALKTLANVAISQPTPENLRAVVDSVWTMGNATLRKENGGSR